MGLIFNGFGPWPWLAAWLTSCWMGYRTAGWLGGWLPWPAGWHGRLAFPPEPQRPPGCTRRRPRTGPGGLFFYKPATVTSAWKQIPFWGGGFFYRIPWFFYKKPRFFYKRALVTSAWKQIPSKRAFVAVPRNQIWGLLGWAGLGWAGACWAGVGRSRLGWAGRGRAG